MTPLQTSEFEQLKSDALVINTLDPGDFGATKIPGSINIPGSNDDFVARVEEEAGGKDREIIVYCASESCHSSTHAAKKLEEAGFTRVSDYEAGAEGWKEAGHQLAT